MKKYFKRIESTVITSIQNMKVDLPDLKFNHEVTLDIFCFVAHQIASHAKTKFLQNDSSKDRSLESTINKDTIFHATMDDGSEMDETVYVYRNDEECIFIEVQHHWIEPHFLFFWLWWTEPEEFKREYPVDLLFQHDILREATKTGNNFAEVVVSPCSFRIQTLRLNPSELLPHAGGLEEIRASMENYPFFRFWRAFKSEEFVAAIECLSEVIGLPELGDSQNAFLGAVQSLSQLMAGRFQESVDGFIKYGEQLDGLGFHRYAEACFFFAVDAAKNIDDLNDRQSALGRIVIKLPNIDNQQKHELGNILGSYAVDVFIGVAVLCRRLLEITLEQLLTSKFGVPIKTLVKESRKEGIIKAGTGPGLFSILEVAKWKGILTQAEHNIATHIKDFGNRIHDKGGVKNRVDAKYALQACIHILRRLNINSGNPT